MAFIEYVESPEWQLDPDNIIRIHGVNSPVLRAHLKVFHEKANISQATWCVLSIRHVLDFSRLGRGGTGFAGFHSHSWWSLSERDTVHAGVRLSRGAALSATT